MPESSPHSSLSTLKETMFIFGMTTYPAISFASLPTTLDTPHLELFETCLNKLPVHVSPVPDLHALHVLELARDVFVVTTRQRKVESSNCVVIFFEIFFYFACKILHSKKRFIGTPEWCHSSLTSLKPINICSNVHHEAIDSIHLLEQRCSFW